MNYIYSSYVFPKIPRKRRQNPSPEEWKKKCEERNKLLVWNKKKESEAIEINNDDALKANSGYTENEDDCNWDGTEKWELEKNEKPSVENYQTLSKNINISTATASCVSSFKNIAESSIDEKMDEINDQMETLTIE